MASFHLETLHILVTFLLADTTLLFLKINMFCGVGFNFLATLGECKYLHTLLATESNMQIQVQLKLVSPAIYILRFLQKIFFSSFLLLEFCSP